MSDRGAWRTTLGLVLVALAVNVSMHVLTQAPVRYGQDPYGYLELADSLRSGRGFTYDHAWESPDARTVPSFAPLYPALLALVFRVFGHSTSAAWWATAVIVALVVGAVHRLARALLIDEHPEPAPGPHARRVDVPRPPSAPATGREELARNTALLLAGMPLLVRASLSLMSEGLALLFATLAALALLRAIERPLGSAFAWALLFGLTGALAVAARYAMAAPIGAESIVLVVLVLRRGRPAVGLAALVVLAVSIGSLAWFLPTDAWRHHPVALSWAPHFAWATEGSAESGRLSWGLPLAAAYTLDLLRPGIAFLGAGLIAAWGFVVAPGRVKQAVLVAVVPMLVLIVGLPQHNPRFLLPLLPAVALLVAFAIEAAGTFGPLVLAGALVVGLGGSAREGLRMAEQSRHERALTTALAGAFDARHGAPRVFTLTTSAMLGRELAPTTGAEIIEAYSSTDGSFDAALARPGDCWLAVPRDLSQWNGRPELGRIERARDREVGAPLDIERFTVVRLRCGP